MTEVTTTTEHGHTLTRAGRNIIITNESGDVVGIAPNWTTAEAISGQIARDARIDMEGDDNHFADDGGDYDIELLGRAPEKVVSKQELLTPAALVLAALEAEARKDATAHGTGVSSTKHGARVHYYPQSDRYSYFHERGVDTKSYVLATIEYELSNLPINPSR